MADWAPDFIGIGAEKSATTWAWTVLDRHPDIGMSQPKEVDYFNHNADKSISWYRRHFPTTSPVTGEISPLYMDDPEVAAGIAEAFPDVRLLVMLREPKDRLLSQLMHAAQNAFGGTAGATPDKLRRLLAEEDSFVRRSCYTSALRPFFERFHREQLGIFFFDDVRQQPEETTRRIYRFVGADPEYVPESAGERVNRSVDYRFPAVFRAARSMTAAARAFGPTRACLQWLHRSTSLRERALQWLYVDRGRPQIDVRDLLTPEMNRRLSEDLAALPELIGQSVPESWMAPVQTAKAA